MFRMKWIVAAASLMLSVQPLSASPTFDPSVGVDSAVASPVSQVGTYIVRYLAYGRWQGVGPLSYYDACQVLQQLQSQGYQAYIDAN